MNNIFKIQDYFGHILEEVVKADAEFRQQQEWFSKNNSEFKGPIGKEVFTQLEQAHLNETSPEKLGIQQIEVCVYLKKHHPPLLKRIWLRLQGIKPVDLYKIGTAADADIPVKFIINRREGVSSLTGDTNPADLGNKYLQT